MDTLHMDSARQKALGPPKFDRRLREKMEAAGFNRLEPQSLGKLVHYAWMTLALTSPVECVLFRLIAVEDNTIDEVVKYLGISDRQVRRLIQSAENRLISIIEFYREIGCLGTKSADRIYGCFLTLMPKQEAQSAFHCRLLDIFFHALSGQSGSVKHASARMAWEQPDAKFLSWPSSGRPAPPEQTLITGVIQVLTTAENFTEVSRICRCIIALANDKSLSEAWRGLLEAILPGKEDANLGRAKMLLFREKRISVCHAMLVLMARSCLDWGDICCNRFAKLTDLGLDRRVEICYFEFLSAPV